MLLTGFVVGAALGIVLQRGRFCVTGMLRDIFLQRSWRGFSGLMVVIAVHAVGLNALASAGVIAPEHSPLAPIGVIGGSLIFGLGIVLAGGCASGTWYRAGEGLVGSWLALVAYAATASAMKGGALGWLNDAATAWRVPLTTVDETLGISPWWLVALLVAITAVMVRRQLRRETPTPRAVKQAIPPLRRPIPLYPAAVLVGLIGVIAWPLSAATGRNSGLGITTPSAYLAEFITTGDPETVDWGVLLVLGILLGATVAAVASKEFRVRVPDAATARNSLIGGVLMGIGAATAGGCTVGNGMVETSLMSYQGWVSLLFIALGVGLATKLWLKPADEAKAQATSPGAGYSSAESIGTSVDAPAEPAAPQPAAPAASGGNASGSSPAAAAAAAVPRATGLIDLAEKPRSAKATPLGDGRYLLDQFGAVCPFPLIEAKDVMATLKPGERLVVDFDCVQATDSLPRWAAEEGYEVTDFQQTGNAGWRIEIEKR